MYKSLRVKYAVRLYYVSMYNCIYGEIFHFYLYYTFLVALSEKGFPLGSLARYYRLVPYYVTIPALVMHLKYLNCDAEAIICAEAWEVNQLL